MNAKQIDKVFGGKMRRITITSLFIVLSCLLIDSCSKGSDKPEAKNQMAAEVKQLWTCTMHPQVISDRPGVCPICAMELIKKVSEDNSKPVDMKNMVTLSDNKLILANVSTVQIRKEDLIKKVTAYSYIDFADQNRKVITARFNGRIEKLFVNKTGDNISKGQALFEIYSPDLVQAQNEYLIALAGEKSMGSLLNSVRKKLQIFGLTDGQINEIEKTKEVKMTMTYYSPVGGTVIEKKVQEGMYVNEGMALFDIADLSMLWNIAEVFESDLETVKIGSKVKLTLQSYPGEAFEGRVSFIYPVVNPQTRSIKVRSEFANSNGKLKPQMFGETTFERNFGRGLLVPSDAVLFMGKKNVVWLKAGDGMFEAREVTVGMKINDDYQIISGINEGDEVAKTGGYLIDSESQLKSGMATGHQHNETKAPSTNSIIKEKKSSSGTEEHNGHNK